MQPISIARLLAGFALALSASACGEEASCNGKSYSLKSWTVKDFDFHAAYMFSTPAHQNSWGYVNFTLENPAVDYTPICTAASDQLSDFFYGTVTYNGQGVPDGDEASFTFSRPTNQLQLNQTWHCPDENSAFDATGGVILDLTCQDVKWQNPDWQMGEFYSTDTITCDFVTVSAPVEVHKA